MNLAQNRAWLVISLCPDSPPATSIIKIHREGKFLKILLPGGWRWGGGGGINLGEGLAPAVCSVVLYTDS